MKTPSLKDVQDYCWFRNSPIDPEQFYDYQISVGWKVGKKPMKDWQAAIRTWERNHKQEGKQSIIQRANDRSWAN